MTALVDGLMAAAVWLVLTWLAYRLEYREFVAERETERAYAEGYKLKAQVAIEQERRKRYDLRDVTVDTKGVN